MIGGREAPAGSFALRVAGSLLSLAVLTFAACTQGASLGAPANPTVASDKVAPILAAAAQQLAAGQPASDYTRGPVRADADGRLQVYVYVTRLSHARLRKLSACGLAKAMPSTPLRLVQGWATPQAIHCLAALMFVSRITPPRYAHPR